MISPATVPNPGYIKVPRQAPIPPIPKDIHSTTNS